MSVEDGLVMQLHPGAFATTTRRSTTKYGRDMGADIPSPTDYVQCAAAAAGPVRQRAESHVHPVHAGRDAPTPGTGAAGRALSLPAAGPPWWFHDSPEGMRRFREQDTETAGFYNTVGFNDDTRAFLSIPARHDVARRIDCAYLGTLVAEHRLDEDEAFEGRTT